MKIQDYIKEYRHDKKITQKELGKIFGVSQDTISLWELGKIKPDYETLRKMCILFEIDGNEILEISTNAERKDIHIENSFNNNKNTKIDIKN